MIQKDFGQTNIRHDKKMIHDADAEWLSKKNVQQQKPSKEINLFTSYTVLVIIHKLTSNHF